MKKILLCIMMATMIAIHSDAQNDKVYDSVEVMPEYPGGMQALFDYMMNSIKYPAEALKQKIEGKVA